MTEELNYDLEPVEVPVVIKGKRYVLTEASGDAEVKRQNVFIRGTKIGANGKPQGMDNFADAEPLLVSQCLYEAGPKGELRLKDDGDPDPQFRVSEKQVRRWPARIQKSLYARIMKMSGLKEDGELETEESIIEKINDLHKRLKEIKDGESPEKKLQSAGTDG